MKVLVIPEDPTYNGYILKPLIEKIMSSIGKPNAEVIVLTNPFATGYEMIKAALPDICERYRHFDCMLFLPDQDCQDRAAELANVETQAQQIGVKLLACAAVQEVEAWLLAGHTDKLNADWKTIRNDCDLKERYFNPFLAEHGDRSVGDGRKRLMREALTHFDGILMRCPELKELRQRLQTTLALN